MYYASVIEGDERVESEVFQRFQHANIRPPILCVGARLGGEVRAFKRVTGSSNVTGIDFNPGHNNPDVVYGDAMNLPYEDGAFETIYTNILDHIPDLHKAFSEMSRVLRQGGTVLVDMDQNGRDSYAVRDLRKQRAKIETLMQSYFGKECQRNTIVDPRITKDPGKFVYRCNDVHPKMAVMGNALVKKANPHQKYNIIERKHQFVLYASIFGDYNEEEGLGEQLEPFTKFDVGRFLFTDSKTIRNIPGWNIFRMESGEGIHGVPGHRVCINELKFLGHDKIRNYRYRIHVETYKGQLQMLHKALQNGLLDYVRCHPSKALFVEKHPFRTTIQQEVNTLKAKDALQPSATLNKWDAHLKPMYSHLNLVHLPSLWFWVLDTQHDSFVHKWTSVHSTLLEWGLWRDQIVYSYALKNVHGEVEHIDHNSSMTCPDKAQLNTSGHQFRHS